MSRPIVRRHGDTLRGLPGRLPPDEQVLWQGRPDWRVLARRALHLRALSFYFVALLAWFAIADWNRDNLSRTIAGICCLTLAGLVALGLVAGFAFLLARSSVYTLTDRRIVLRIGIALTMSVNLPLGQIEAASLRAFRDGHGDIALATRGRQTLGYLLLWPHARPWRLARPEPMLRAVPEAATVARLLGDALARTLERLPAHAPAEIAAVTRADLAAAPGRATVGAEAVA